jgi:FMN phosphatase YigB (HAD superfamily)
MPIRNIIFDLGAVLLDIDYNRTADAFKKLGLVNFDAIYSKKKQDHFFDDFEKGLMPEEVFRSEIRKHLPATVTDNEIDSAWNAMLIGMPAGRTDWLTEMGKRYRIFLLSNTNTIHIRGFQHLVGESFHSLFEKTYYSCELGMRKPDAEIFERVITENILKRSETLFIDDSPQHVEGAKRFGLSALHLKDGVRVEEILQLVSEKGLA